MLRKIARSIQTTESHYHGPQILPRNNAVTARQSRRNFTTDLTQTTAQRTTIYALSTPLGKGGVAIVRVSGPDALSVWHKMVRSHNPEKPRKAPVPWKLQRCRIVHPENESLIDDGLAVYFKGSPKHRPVFFGIISLTIDDIQRHIPLRPNQLLNYTSTLAAL